MEDPKNRMVETEGDVWVLKPPNQAQGANLVCVGRRPNNDGKCQKGGRNPSAKRTPSARRSFFSKKNGWSFEGLGPGDLEMCGISVIHINRDPHVSHPGRLTAICAEKRGLAMRGRWGGISDGLGKTKYSFGSG